MKVSEYLAGGPEQVTINTLAGEKTGHRIVIEQNGKLYAGMQWNDNLMTFAHDTTHQAFTLEPDQTAEEELIAEIKASEQAWRLHQEAVKLSPIYKAPIRFCTHGYRGNPAVCVDCKAEREEESSQHEDTPSLEDSGLFLGSYSM